MEAKYVEDCSVFWWQFAWDEIKTMFAHWRFFENDFKKSVSESVWPQSRLKTGFRPQSVVRCARLHGKSLMKQAEFDPRAECRLSRTTICLGSWPSPDLTKPTKLNSWRSKAFLASQHLLTLFFCCLHPRKSNTSCRKLKFLIILETGRKLERSRSTKSARKQYANSIRQTARMGGKGSIWLNHGHIPQKMEASTNFRLRVHRVMVEGVDWEANLQVRVDGVEGNMKIQ